jgi:hypothetical protein
MRAAMGVDRLEVGRRLLRFKDAARKAGVKLTHQRLEIFREVASSIDHPAVEAVFRAVQSRIPTVSLDTDRRHPDPLSRWAGERGAGVHESRSLA